MEWFVYLIQTKPKKKVSVPVKIGVTSNAERRLKSLQTGSPFKLHCTALIPCKSKESAYDLESFLHKQLSRHRMEGEWFRQNFALKPLIAKYNRIYEQSVEHIKY